MADREGAAPGAAVDAQVLLRRWLQDGWLAGNVAIVDECFHDDFVGHDPDVPVRGLEELKQAVLMSRGALADVAFDYGEFIQTEDRIGVSWTVRATHVASFGGIPPSGQQIEFHGSVIFRVVDGRFKEGWQTVDMSAVLRASGLALSVPSPPNAPLPDWAERWRLAARYVPVARLMIEGLSDGEISLHTGLSPQTVRTYAREVLHRAKVNGRVELARAAGAQHAG